MKVVYLLEFIDEWSKTATNRPSRALTFERMVLGQLYFSIHINSLHHDMENLYHNIKAAFRILSRWFHRFKIFTSIYIASETLHQSFTIEIDSMCRKDFGYCCDTSMLIHVKRKYNLKDVLTIKSRCKLFYNIHHESFGKS